MNRSGILKGLIPEYEILKARLCGTPQSSGVAALITSAPQTVRPETPAMEVAGLFRSGFRSSMAVVDHRGRLVGQITRRELIWLLTTLDRLSTPQSSPEEQNVSRKSATQSEPERPAATAPVAAPNFLRKRELLLDSLADSLRPNDQQSHR